MIQIDDAGSGSLVGGTCIGAMRVETGEFFYDIIPIEYYNETNFKNKLYLNITRDISINLLKKLNVDKKEKILICRGYMFDVFKDWLIDEGYNFESVIIKDPLQYKIEKTFEFYASSLGLPDKFLKYTKYPFHFHRLLRWVYADYKNRSLLCKRGWNSWKKYGSLNINISYKIIQDTKNYYCLKCGKDIQPGFVKVIEYVSNYPNTIYIHTNC
ncbi:MAG: hypothetical protein ACPL3A_01060 [Thermoanaerobacteraceae bacterium]